MLCYCQHIKNNWQIWPLRIYNLSHKVKSRGIEKKITDSAKVESITFFDSHVEKK